MTVISTLGAWRHTTLTIASGQTESEELNLEDNGRRIPKNLTFYNPATLPETVVIKLAKTVGGTYASLNDGFGNDVVLLPGKSQVQARVTAGALKLVAGSAVGSDRVFSIDGGTEGNVL